MQQSKSGAINAPCNKRSFARYLVRHDHRILLVIIHCRQTSSKLFFSRFRLHSPDARSFLTTGCDVTDWRGRPAVFAASVPKNAVFLPAIYSGCLYRTCTYHSHDFVAFVVFPHQGLHFGGLRKRLGASQRTRDDQGIIFILQIVDETACR